MELNPENRTQMIKARVSEEEKCLIQAKAEHYCYKSLSQYIRDAAIYEKVTIVDLAGKHEILKAYAKQFNITKLVSVVSGGKTGFESIIKGTKEVERLYPEDNTIILVHDAIRPNLLQEIISNNYFSIIYDDNEESDDKGIFLIGIEPHLYDKEKYEEKNIRRISTKGRNFFIFWSLHPDLIYFANNGQKINVTNNLVCSLEYNLGLIYGTKEYQDLIKQYFFDKLILEKKCHEEIVYNAYTVFYCYNKNDIKKFPTLNLYLQQFLFTFNLDYNDLFLEKNGKYFFKIIFDKNNKMQWKLGKPFLKKYTLFYDYEAKTVGFYNQELFKKRSKIWNVLLYIFCFIIICVFGFVGFHYGKKAYDKVRKKRIYEIDDNYEYNNNSEKINSNSFVEMMIKPK